MNMGCITTERCGTYNDAKNIPNNPRIISIPKNYKLKYTYNNLRKTND